MRKIKRYIDAATHQYVHITDVSYNLSNSCSSYCIVGSFILMLAGNSISKNERKDGQSVFWSYTLLYALLNFVIGVNSAFYHASLTYLPQFFDNFGFHFIFCWVWYFISLIVRLLRNKIVATKSEKTSLHCYIHGTCGNNSPDRYICRIPTANVLFHSNGGSCYSSNRCRSLKAC